jgi:hypothetical protein
MSKKESSEANPVGNIGSSHGNNDAKSETLASPGAITRRKAIFGGMSALALGAFKTQKANAQSAPLVALGGLCEGHVVKLSASDSTAWMQQQLQTNNELNAFYKYFTGQGLTFSSSRSKVYMFMGTPVSGNGPGIRPGIFGILPGLQPNNVDTISLVATSDGLAFAGGVVANPSSFAIEQFKVFDLVPPGNVVENSITATDLQTMSVCQAASQLGTPPVVPGRFTPADTAQLSQPEQSTLLATTYQSMLSDSRPIYSQATFNAKVTETPLVQKWSDVIYQRAVNAGCAVGVAAGCSGNSGSCGNCGTNCGNNCGNSGVSLCVTVSVKLCIILI